MEKYVDVSGCQIGEVKNDHLVMHSRPRKSGFSGRFAQTLATFTLPDACDHLIRIV